MLSRRAKAYSSSSSDV